MTLHTYPEVEQGSEEWHTQRRGMVTASVVGQLITVGTPDPIDVDCIVCPANAGSPCLSLNRKDPTPIKTFHPVRIQDAGDLPPVISPADNDTSRGLTNLLAAERITGHTDPVYVNDDMMRGTLDEPFAAELYAEHYAPVEVCGFMVREGDGWRLGYSPDRLVGDDGLIEIKSPRAKNHLRTILADEVPAQNMAQCQAGLFVSGREWLDFVSYRGGMPLYVKRVTPDPKWFKAIEQACIAFERNVEAIVQTYNERTAGLIPTERIDHFAEITV